MCKKYRLFLYVGFFLWMGCKSDFSPFVAGEARFVKEFPLSVSVKSEKLEIEIPGVNDLFVADTFLIGFHAVTGEKFYTVYSTNHLQYLGKCLGRRKGPEEFVSLVYPDLYEKEKGEIKLWHSDYVKDELFLLNLTRSLQENKTILDSLHYKTIYPYAFTYPLNDSIFEVFLPQEENLVFTQYQWAKKKEILRKELLKEFSPEVMSVLKYLNIKIKPDRKKMAISLARMGMLHFCAPAYDTCFTIAAYKIPEMPKKNLISEEREFPTYYKGIRVNDRFVVALYVYPPESPTVAPRMEFQFFDWNGNPLFCFSVPEDIVTFALDPYHDCLYALTGKEEVYRYTFSR